MITDRFNTSVPVDKNRGPLKQMYSGRMVYVLDLKPEDVCSTDIAHHLAIYNRWTGATIDPFSVAQHSMLVADYAAELSGGDRVTELYALLHDAAEAYIGDICRPVKAALSMKAPGVLEEIEAGVDAAIFAHFNLPPEMPSSIATVVHMADQVVTSTEGRDILPRAITSEPGADWRIYMPTPMSTPINPSLWWRVEHRFHMRLLNLSGSLK